MMRTFRRLQRRAWRQIPNAVSLALTFSLLVSSVPIGPFGSLPAQALIGDLTQEDYRWYDNIDAVQPTTGLANENTALTAQASGAVYQLRMSVSNGGNNVGAGAIFRLQYATSTAGTWFDVGGVGSGTIWRGFDNPTPADGAAITTLLVNSDSQARQTYEEANPATTLRPFGKNRTAEWGWVLENNGAAGTTTYFFQMIRNDGTQLLAYTNYPELATAAAASVTITESGGTTNVTEGGGTDTYDVVLDAAPTGTVTITLATPGADVSASPSILTFTTGDWFTPQTDQKSVV